MEDRAKAYSESFDEPNILKEIRKKSYLQGFKDCQLEFDVKLSNIKYYKSGVRETYYDSGFKDGMNYILTKLKSNG